VAVKQSHRFASRALDGEGSLELAAGVRTLTLRVEESRAPDDGHWRPSRLTS